MNTTRIPPATAVVWPPSPIPHDVCAIAASRDFLYTGGKDGGVIRCGGEGPCTHRPRGGDDHHHCHGTLTRRMHAGGALPAQRVSPARRPGRKLRVPACCLWVTRSPYTPSSPGCTVGAGVGGGPRRWTPTSSCSRHASSHSRVVRMAAWCTLVAAPGMTLPLFAARLPQAGSRARSTP